MKAGPIRTICPFVGKAETRYFVLDTNTGNLEKGLGCRSVGAAPEGARRHHSAEDLRTAQVALSLRFTTSASGTVKKKCDMKPPMTTTGSR